MRFFKGFSLLHRRTKSATFVPGAAFDSDTYSSSSLTQVGADITPPRLSLFDLVTSKVPLTLATFNHLEVKNESDRLPGLRRTQRSIDRDSQYAGKESLRGSVNIWVQEYSKVQELLKSCTAELVAERLKTAALERIIEADKQEIMDLQISLSRCKGTFSDIQHKQPINHLSNQLPSVLSAANSQITIAGSRNKPRTLDEYSSALRVTLATRRALRNQKKVTKYWKQLAVVDGQQGAVTPSVSTISSVREILSADRQAAVEALVARRYRLSLLKPKDSFSEIPSAGLSELAQTQGRILDSTSTILPCQLSRNSDLRLGPLASESMKQEVSTLFGSHNSFKRLSSSRSRLRGSLDTSSEELSKYSIDSFGDLNVIFERAFGVDQTTKRTVLSKVDQETDKQSSYLPQKPLLLPSMPPCSIRTEESQTWVNIERMSSQDTKPPGLHQAQPSLKQAGKECTPRRSWQKYTAKPTVSKRSSGGGNRKDIIARKPGGEKEPNGFSMSLPVFKRIQKNSRLPVPASAKR